jgi:hypothetical protein
VVFFIFGAFLEGFSFVEFAGVFSHYTFLWGNHTWLPCDSFVGDLLPSDDGKHLRFDDFWLNRALSVLSFDSWFRKIWLDLLGMASTWCASTIPEVSLQFVAGIGDRWIRCLEWTCDCSRVRPWFEHGRSVSPWRTVCEGRVRNEYFLNFLWYHADGPCLLVRQSVTDGQSAADRWTIRRILKVFISFYFN